MKVSGGLFLDMMIHDFDMARFLMGEEVTELMAAGNCLVDPEIGKCGDKDGNRFISCRRSDFNINEGHLQRGLPLTEMKKCIAVSTPGAKFAALASRENFRDSIRKVAELGYDAVELHIRDPREIDHLEIASLLNQYQLSVPTIGTGQAYGEEGLSFPDPDPEIRQQAVQRIKDQIDLAAKLNIPMVTIGLIRGTVKPGVDKDQAEEYVRECLIECLDHKPAIVLLIEPLNRYETSLYNDTTSVKALIDRIGKPNLKLLIDTFHMNIEEPDIIQSIITGRDYISHVHFADSNRWAPGCGHLNFKKILSALRKIKYRGAICAEVLPEPTPEECLMLTIAYFRKLGL